MAHKAGVATCFRWQGLLSILLLLTIFTNHQHCAESFSNYINIDDDDDVGGKDGSEDITTNTDSTLLSTTTSSYYYTSTLLSSSVADKTTPAISRSSIKISSTRQHHQQQRFPPPSKRSQKLSPPPLLEEEEEDEIDSRVIMATSESTISSSSLTSFASTTEANEISYQFNFAHPIYNVTIPENSVQKTYAIQPYSDKDRMGIQLFDDKPSHHIIDVKYQIIGGDKNKIFKADERIVGDFAFLTIRTRTNNIVLNREKGDSYRLKIKATITRSSRIGTKRRSIQEADALVDVKVLDKNDLSPLFYPTKYSITIADDTPLHQSILRVTAEDADVGINGGKSKVFLIFRDIHVCISLTSSDNNNVIYAHTCSCHTNVFLPLLHRVKNFLFITKKNYSCYRNLL